VTNKLDALFQRMTRASHRKLRLLACACAREIWHALGDPASRLAVETAERYADGEATSAELDEAWEAAREAAERADRAGALTDVRDGAWTAWAAAAISPLDAASHALEYYTRLQRSGRSEPRARAPFAEIVDCVVGLQPQPFASGTWLSANAGTVRRLAEGVYADRAFERLPLLADALEDAGCTDAELLSHLRGPGLHVRGCWAVDLVLGKS
jgi:hypothetical protein